MKAKEIKDLTGAKYKAAGVAILCKQIEAKPWLRNGRAYCFAGYDQRKDLVHFTCTWAVPGGAGHSRVGISLRDAMNSTTGDLTCATVLH